MTTDTLKTTKIEKQSEPRIKAVQVNPETFDMICRSLYNQTCELAQMARDISELRLAFERIGMTLNAMGIDLRSLAQAHQLHPGFRQEQAPPVNIDTLAKRLDDVGNGTQDAFPRMLRNAAKDL